MNRNKAPRNSEDLFKLIQSLSAEAEWSAAELRDALNAEGIDPEQLVNEIKMKFSKLSQASLPLLPRLRQITGLKATAIAAKLGISVPFLSDLSSHPQVIPLVVKKEFASRAVADLPGVSERDVLDSFAPGSYQLAAAYRDTPFPEEESISFEKIVKRSDMSEEQQQYWLNL